MIMKPTDEMSTCSVLLAANACDSLFSRSDGNETLQAIQQALEIRTRNLARWHWGSHDVALIGIGVVRHRCRAGGEESGPILPCSKRGRRRAGSKRTSVFKIPAPQVKVLADGAHARLDHR